MSLLDLLPVTILELAPPFRLLTLGGKDKPEAGVDAPQYQRANKTHYPGTGSASVQVMGTADDAIVLKGWFHDPLTFVDGGPQARVALVRGLLQGQNRCQLNWGPAISKWGRVSRFVPTFFGQDRIRYEITFDVDQSLELVAPAPLPLISSTVGDLRDAASAAVAAASVAVEAVDTVNTFGGVVL